MAKEKNGKVSLSISFIFCVSQHWRLQRKKKDKACCLIWVPKFAIVSMTVLVCMEKGSEMGKDKAVTIKGNAHFQKSLMVNAVYADKYIALIRHDCNKSKVKGGMINWGQDLHSFSVQSIKLCKPNLFQFLKYPRQKTLHWRVNCYPLSFSQCTTIHNYWPPC